MDPVSLTIGVVGLVGLFSTCLDAIDKVSSYQSYEADSQDLNAQFAADKLRFLQWGRHVGIDQRELAPVHHPALDAPEVFSTISHLLITIERILRLSNASNSSSPVADGPSSVGHRKLPNSMKAKLSWALRTRGERVQQVALFGTFVQKLHDLVPLEANGMVKSLQG